MLGTGDEPIPAGVQLQAVLNGDIVLLLPGSFAGISDWERLRQTLTVGRARRS